MNRMRSFLLVPLLACILPLLTACFHEHVWVDATCTEPATCSVCGETEGDPLGHEWIEATCASPKTCEVCGETEGEPLGHDWIPATHDTPETCSRCGETRGEPLLFEIPAGMTTDYQFGEFETFNSPASENGLGGTMIWFNGTYEEVFTLDMPDVKPGLQAFFARVTDGDGNVWVVELDYNEYEGIDKYSDLVGHELCIMGEYQGYSALYEAPVVLVERVFDQTTGIIIYSTMYADLY